MQKKAAETYTKRRNKNNLAVEREHTAMHRPQPGADMHLATSPSWQSQRDNPPCRTEGICTHSLAWIVKLWGSLLKYPDLT